MEVLAYIAFGFLVIRSVIAGINYFTAPLPKNPGVPGEPFVSIIIPARNEEDHIESLLRQILESGYRKYEVLVYDDQSEDDTAGIVRNMMKEDKRIRLIRGNDLPEGWLGKNNACHQAARDAKGELLLFLDADVVVRDDLIFRVVRSLRENRLDLLSVFPVQKMRSLGEWLAVPLMNWVLLSLLPLVLTRSSSWKTFSAANGQLMLFRKEQYDQYLFHEKVRDRRVEDIAIMKYMKGKDLKVRTFLSTGEISCRMYRGYSDAVSGFSKNIVGIFGNNPFMLFLYLLFTNFGIFAIFWWLPGIWISIYLFLFILMRGFVSLASRQNFFKNLLYSPLQQVTLNIIALSALRYKLAGGLVWKGRKI